MLLRLFERAEAGTWRGQRLKMIMLLLLDTGICNKDLINLRLGTRTRTGTGGKGMGMGWSWLGG